MGGELVLVQKEQAVAAAVEEQRLPELVERAGGAARFAWDEFFYAEHHNPHTQRAYQAAVRRFLAWCEGEGVELASISPGMVGQYLVGLGGSAVEANLHLSALRGFFDRLVQRHVVMLNPAASVSGVKETGGRGQDAGDHAGAGPEAAGVDQDHVHGEEQRGRSPRRSCSVVGLRDRAILATMRFTACRAGAVAKLRLRRFPARRRAVRAAVSGEGRQDAGKSRCGSNCSGISWPISRRRASRAEAKDRPLFRSTVRQDEATDRQCPDHEAASASWSSGG